MKNVQITRKDDNIILQEQKKEVMDTIRNIGPLTNVATKPIPKVIILDE